MTLSLRAWMMIGTGAIIAGLVIALLLTRGALYDEKRERARTEATLAVSNASVSRLEAEFDRVLKDQQSLATDDAARIQASREAAALAEAASQVRKVAIDRLLASAEVERPVTTKVDASCEVSDAVKAVWR